MRTHTLKFLCPRDACGEENEIEAEIEPGEHYGADADGNRGIWLPPSVSPPSAPETCSECRAIYTLEEAEGIEKQLSDAAEFAVIEEWDPPEPDFD